MVGEALSVISAISAGLKKCICFLCEIILSASLREVYYISVRLLIISDAHLRTTILQQVSHLLDLRC